MMMYQDFTLMPGGTSAVMVHEIGHNFAFLHDDEVGPCECDDPAGKCIMNSRAVLVSLFSCCCCCCYC